MRTPRALLAAISLSVAVGGGVALIAAPAQAATVAFIVNSLGDAPDANPGNGTCATAGAVCTLRAAIQEANNGSAANTYTVGFSVAGTLQVGPTDLPAGLHTMTIDGSTAPGYAVATGPTLVLRCTSAASGGNVGLTLDGASTIVRGLRITNCDTGIDLTAGAVGAKVVGNQIGNDGATFVASNAVRSGVIITSADAIVGGTTAADRNVISGYRVIGVLLYDTATNASVRGNYVGTDKTGSTAIRNDATGPGEAANSSAVAIWSQSPSASVTGNLISGNPGTGVAVVTGSTTIKGNLIGTDAAGSAGIGNGGPAIQANPGTTATIGGTGAGEGNVVAYWLRNQNTPTNTSSLIRIIGATSTIQGNTIGANAAGTAALCTGPNTRGIGVEVNPSAAGVGSNVTIGGTTAGAGNVISGCQSNIEVVPHTTEAGASTVVIQGNKLGTNAAGTAALAPSMSLANTGVTIDGDQKVTVGGTAAGAGNVISGNGTGIYLEDNDAGVVIQGNRIGTNAAGTAAVPNGFYGIFATTSAKPDAAGAHLLIGGPAAGAGNVISGNASDGLLVARPATIQGNLIGTNATGTAAIGNQGAYGALLNDKGILFGGTGAGEGNTVSGNKYAGLAIASAQTPTVYGNRIGTNLAGTAGIPNGVSGVNFNSGVTGSFGGTGAGQANVVAYNAGAGIRPFGNTAVDIRGNLAYANTGLNIELYQHGETINVGNHDQIHPTLTTTTIGASTTAVGGTVTSDRTGTILVDVYAGNACQAIFGAGEARQFLGTISVPYPVAGAATPFSGSVAKPTSGTVITATSTIAGNGTSQLSTCATYTDISMSAKDTYGQAPIGTEVATELTVKNSGPTTATSLGIQIEPNAGAFFANDVTTIDTPTVGSVSPSTSVWTIPTLAPGATASVCVRGEIVRASYPLESGGLTLDVPASWAPDAKLDTASGVVDPYTGNNIAYGNTQVGTAVAGANVCALPTLSIDDASLQRPASGTSPMTFTVHLSKAQTRSVAVHWATANGKAVAVEDYVASSGDLTFAAGQTTKTFTVPIVGNQSDEPDKAFTVTLSAPVHATIADGTASGTVLANHLLQGCPPGSTGNQRFVCHLYFDALGRAPEAGGFTYWVNKLNKGTARSTMAKSYLTQPESLRKVADRAYVLYLGRHGTTNELSGWATKLANKTATTQDVRIAVLASSEYFTKVGGTNDKFVKQLFFDVFRRNVDASGLAYWTGQLTSGKSRTNVATRFMAEPEGRRKIIGDIYLRFLRRDPTTNEANGWVSQLAAGKTEVDVGIGLVASTEYYQRPES